MTGVVTVIIAAGSGIGRAAVDAFVAERATVRLLHKRNRAMLQRGKGSIISRRAPTGLMECGGGYTAYSPAKAGGFSLEHPTEAEKVMILMGDNA